jgi:hypothetical protein
MKWVLAGLLFAAVVGLAVTTAAIEVTNVRTRARIQASVDLRQALVIAREAERMRWSQSADPARLTRYWLERQEQP